MDHIDQMKAQLAAVIAEGIRIRQEEIYEQIKRKRRTRIWIFIGWIVVFIILGITHSMAGTVEIPVYDVAKSCQRNWGDRKYEVELCISRAKKAYEEVEYYWANLTDDSRNKVIEEMKYLSHSTLAYSVMTAMVKLQWKEQDQ